MFANANGTPWYGEKYGGEVTVCLPFGRVYDRTLLVR